MHLWELWLSGSDGGWECDRPPGVGSCSVWAMYAVCRDRSQGMCIHQVVQQRSLPSAAQVVRINTAVLGRRSTSMGAVIQTHNLVLDQLTQD